MIRGDILPAALNIWGLAFCARSTVNRRYVFAASLLFALAFAGKETMIFGAAATFFWFVLSGRSKLALRLLLYTSVGYGLVIGIMYLGSAGRVVEIFKVCASAGTTWWSILKSPSHMLFLMRRSDGGCYLFLLLGLWAYFASPVKSKMGIVPLGLVFSAIITILIFASSGISINHLIDLHVISVIMFFIWLSSLSQEKAKIATTALIVALVLSIQVIFVQVNSQMVWNRKANYTKILNIIGKSEKPLLAENTMLPIIAGNKLYLSDPFMFEYILKYRPSLAEPLYEKMRQKGFSAIVLAQEFDPRNKDGLENIRQRYGLRFIEELRKNYSFVNQIGRSIIYLPNHV